MIEIETGLRIERPIDEVFTYVSEPRNFPEWNSATRAVRRLEGPDQTGPTYLMQRELPTGTAENTLEVVTFIPATEFAIRTISGPTPFSYRFRLSPGRSSTIVDVDAEAELGGAATLLRPLVRAAVKRGIEANLATLKAILETAVK